MLELQPDRAEAPPGFRHRHRWQDLIVPLGKDGATTTEPRRDSASSGFESRRAENWTINSGQRHFGGTLNFAVTGNAVLLPASVESALAGIAREALTNATRHSGAPRVEVELAFRDGGAVRLAVADDGVPRAQGGFANPLGGCTMDRLIACLLLKCHSLPASIEF